MTLAKEIEKYISQCKTGKNKVSKTTMLTIDRFLEDVDKASQNKKSFPYILDYSKAETVIEFAQSMVQSKGEFRGRALELAPWQKFIYLNLYGWVYRDNPERRRFQKTYIQVARKNGKTTMVVPILLWDLLTEGGAEIYCCATTLNQSKISFDIAKSMVRNVPELATLIKPYRESLTYKGGKIVPVSSEAGLQDGYNPSIALIDEYHAHRTDELLSVMRTGMGSRLNPLLLIITTAGFNRASPCYSEYERSIKILNDTFQDDNCFIMIFEPDKDDKWDSLDAISKSNPNLGITIKKDYLWGQIKDAKQKPSIETDIKTKNLDIWCDAKEAWIPFSIWGKAKVKYTRDTSSLPSVLAMDLSKRNDFTVLTLYSFDAEVNKYIARHWYYIPEDMIDAKMKSDNIMVRKWIEDEYITAIPGSTIDYSYIAKQINILYQEYPNLVGLVYDPNLSVDVISQVASELLTIPMNQGYWLDEPIAEWEKAIYEERIIDNNPVMDWMLSCSTLEHNSNGKRRVVKPDSHRESKRIDSVITSIMGYAQLQSSILHKPVEVDQQSIDLILGYQWG